MGCGSELDLLLGVEVGGWKLPICLFLQQKDLQEK